MRASHQTGGAALACLILLLCCGGAAARRSLRGELYAEIAAEQPQQPSEGTSMTVEQTVAAATAGSALEALDAGLVHVAGTPAPPPTLPPPPPFLDTNQPVPGQDQIMNDTLNCNGFAQPRTYIEGQAWLTPDLPDVPDAVSTRSMHLHVGACVPHRQWVSGVIKLAILVQRHGYNLKDSTRVELRVEVEGKTSTGTTVKMTTYGAIENDQWTCDTATDLARLCKQVYYMDVQTTTYNATAMEGLNTLRLVGLTPINDTVGLRNIESRIESSVVVWNNKAVNLTYPSGLSGVRPPAQLSTTGFPWAYTHAEYLDEIPLAPFKGNLSIHASSFVLANTANVTGLFISIDPGFHQVPVKPGFVIRNYTAADIPRPDCPVAMVGNISHVDCNKLGTLYFNTSQLADTKWHKLFIRTDSFVPNNHPLILNRTPRVGGGTFSAVALIAFRVNNTGNVIGGSQPSNSTAGVVVGPPAGFSPPPGVAVCDGTEPLPDTSVTLNIASNGYNCSGWLEPRTYMEGGAWFTQPYQAVDYGNGSQLLVGACLPHGQRVAGKIPVDILLQKRNFPSDSGINIKLLVQLDWASGNITFRTSQSSQLTNWTCVQGNCRTIISIQVDTKPLNGSYVAPDGPNALTVEASTTFNWGSSFHTLFSRVHSWVFVTNNRDTNVSIPLNTTGSARLEYPWGNGNFFANLTKLPPLFAPAAGLVPVAFTDSVPINITNTFLAADPVFGAVPDPGLVLWSGSRFTNKTVCTGYNFCKFALNLDTTKLCNGVHTLLLRSDSFVQQPPVLANYGAGTFSASNMATFTVANAVDAANCRPPPAAALSTVRPAGASSAHLRAWRAARLAPERVVMAASPRVVQPLEVVEYHV